RSNSGGVVGANGDVENSARQFDARGGPARGHAEHGDGERARERASLQARPGRLRYLRREQIRQGQTVRDVGGSASRVGREGGTNGPAGLIRKDDGKRKTKRNQASA